MSYLLHPSWISQLHLLKTLQVLDMVLFGFALLCFLFPLLHHSPFPSGLAPKFSLTSGLNTVTVSCPMRFPECTLASSQEVFALIGSPAPTAHEPSALLIPARHLRLTTIAGALLSLLGPRVESTRKVS